MVIQELIEKLPEKVDWDHLREQLKDRKVQVGILAGVTTTYFLYKQLTKKRYKLPPGPMALPLIGNLHNLGMSNLHKKFTELTKIYGPVFTVYLGPQRAIVLNTMEVIREAFIHKGPEFGGRMKSPSMQLFTDNGKGIGGAQYGPLLKIQRKIIHAALRKYASGENFEDLIEECFQKTVAEIDKVDGPVDPKEHLMVLHYNIFASMCFGEQFTVDDPFILNMKQAFEDMSTPEFSNSMMLIDTFPILASDFIGLKAWKKMKELFDYFYGFVGSRFDEHLENYDPDNLKDVMDEMIYNWKEGEAEKEDQTALSQLTKSHFVFIIFDIFSAGTDTSRLAIAWVILYLAAHPEIQKKVYAEVDSVYGSRKPTLRAKDELHYLYAVFHEVMRIVPLAAIGFPHVTMCDTTLGKYDIPADTMVFSNTYAIHYDPKAYNEPTEFRPERWLDNNGKININAGPWNPFSMGTRVCVGESLAKVELLMVLALFIQRYEFLPPPGEKLSLEPKEIMGGLDTPPFKVVFKNRY